MSLTSLPKAESANENGLSRLTDAHCPPLLFSSASRFIHYLLFIQEFPETTSGPNRPDLAPISFFLHRSGGFHLLLLLLNVAYFKRSAGRTKGWPFGVLAARVHVSRRSLRQLLADAIAEGYVERRSGHNDKRRVVYCATPCVVDAWAALFDNLTVGLENVFAEFGSDTLVDMDYREFDPRKPARTQVPPPADSVYLKSADPTPTIPSELAD